METTWVNYHLQSIQCSTHTGHLKSNVCVRFKNSAFMVLHVDSLRLGLIAMFQVITITNYEKYAT